MPWTPCGILNCNVILFPPVSGVTTTSAFWFGRSVITFLISRLFEYAVINYRPVLIEGILEASYPSSTTLLTLCVMPTAAMQLRARIKNGILRRAAVSVILIFTAFMIVERILSGVHWITDIIGGIILSAGFVAAYACDFIMEKGRK
jgi:undecaprenyl-diphosphatase